MARHYVKKETRKVQVLKAVQLYSDDRGYPPTYRDISRSIGVTHSHVHELVQSLRADGLIHEQDEKRARAITLTELGHAALDDGIPSITDEADSAELVQTG